MSKYTIKETAQKIWLPESTLRYYETMWLIENISRDPSSKHRSYSEENINLLWAIACLNATWMSIWDMKRYLTNLNSWDQSHKEQIKILKDQEKKLIQEEKNIKIRKKYIQEKIKYWNAINSWDELELNKIKDSIYSIIDDLKTLNKVKDNIYSIAEKIENIK